MKQDRSLRVASRLTATPRLDELLIVLLLCGTHDKEDVDEPPDAATTTSDEFQYTHHGIADVETVDAVSTDDSGDDDGYGGILIILTEYHAGLLRVHLLNSLTNRRHTCLGEEFCSLC